MKLSPWKSHENSSLWEPLKCVPPLLQSYRLDRLVYTRTWTLCDVMYGHREQRGGGGGGGEGGVNKVEGAGKLNEGVGTTLRGECGEGSWRGANREEIWEVGNGREKWTRNGRISYEGKRKFFIKKKVNK